MPFIPTGIPTITTFIGPGSTFANVQAAVSALIAGDVLVMKPGAYDFGAATLLIPSGVTISAYGATITSAAVTSSYPNGAAIRLNGPDSSAFVSLLLTANTNEGDLTLSLSAPDAATLNPGDALEISDLSALGGVNNHRERNVVKGVSGTTVTLKWPLNFAYLTANTAACSRFVPGLNTQWLGGTIDMSGAASGSADGIIAAYVDAAQVRDVTVQNHRGAGVDLWACVNSETVDIRILNPTAVAAGQGYGTRLQFCRFSRMVRSYGESCRHIMDITGGSDNTGDGVYGGGRTTDPAQTGAFLHGLESKRCRFTDVKATNMVQGLAAGNGTFGSDYDFVFDGFELNQCDDSVYITQSCTGWRISNGVVFNSNIRGIALDTTVSGSIEDVTIDGILTNPANNGALDIGAGTGTQIRVSRVSIRNTIYRQVRVTGSGDVELHDLDCYQTSANIVLALSSFTGRVMIFGGVYWFNGNSAVEIMFLSSAAALTLVDGATLMSSSATAASNGAHILGGPTIGIIRNCHIFSTQGSMEGVRVESPNVSVLDNTILVSSNHVRTNGTVTAISVYGNRYLGAGAKLTNTAAATVNTDVGATGALPGADPHIPGWLWSNAGTITISAG